MADKLRIIVTGLVAQYPLGGVAWDYFHYLTGLSELGHDVVYHEDTWVWPYDPTKGYPTDDPSYAVKFLGDFFRVYAPHLESRWHYLLLHDKSFGMSREAFDAFAASADIFLNVSGAGMIPEALSPKCLKVFLDTDPGYNQIVLKERPKWSENVDRWCDAVRRHDRHLTYAENIYGHDCLVPRLDFDWRTTRAPVSLAPWSAFRQHRPAAKAPWTTVMTWDYFRGTLATGGREFRSKSFEFEKYLEMPAKSPVPLRIAMAGPKAPTEQLKGMGWDLVSGQETTLTPQGYMSFIDQSRGEWSVAKNVYADSRSGWFSCRTCCYLAAGRPAVVQDTGWSRFIPTGDGLLGFASPAEAAAGLARVEADYPRHAAAAYDIAREYFAPDRVLSDMVRKILA